MQSIQDVSEETLRLENILSSATPGEFFLYTQLENLANVKMDNRGKNFLRTALKRLKMPYEVSMGSGITVLSPKNATKIVIDRVVKVDKAIRRAEKTTKQVKDRVYNELTEPEKKNINFLGALFGTIRSYSLSAKRIFAKKELISGEKIS